MKHFTKQNHWSLADRFAMGCAVNRWLAMLPMLLLMLLAPTRSGGQNVASDPRYDVFEMDGVTIESITDVGDYPWTVMDLNSDGMSAVRDKVPAGSKGLMPGNCNRSGTSEMAITVTSDKACMLSFEYAGYITNTSKFTIIVDGNWPYFLELRSGPRKFFKCNLTLSAGKHELRFRYYEDYSVGTRQSACIYNIKAVSSFSGPGAVYDPSTNTLTLKECVSEPISENLFAVTNGMVLSEKINKYITKVVIDESFKAFAPTTLNSFFKDLRSLETVQGLGNLNTTNVTDMTWMFYECPSLVNLDIENLKTENVTGMTAMFYDCKKLKSLDLSGFRTEKVTLMGEMFKGCYDLEELNLSSFNTSLVEYMRLMFYGASKLSTIYVSELFSTAKLKDSGNMFYGCYKLPNFSSDTDATRAHYGEGGYFTYLPPYVTACVVYDTKSKVLSFRKFGATGENEKVVANLYNPSGNANWFNGESDTCSWPDEIKNATSVVIDPSFKTYAIPTCENMFWGFQALKSIKGLENLNMSNVENMNYMFYGCSALESIDVSGLNSANVTNMNYTFCGCSSLTSIDLTNFNTAKVTDMSKMFSGCSSLTSLDLSSFDTGNVSFFDEMMSYCSNLTTVYVSDKFVITGVNMPEYSMNMFYASEKLKGFAIYSSAYGKHGVEYANYKTGYLTKLVAKNGSEKIGAVGETLTATGTVAFSDDKDFEAYDKFKIVRGTYSRIMSEGTTWASLCLPFSVSLQGRNFRAFKIVSLGRDKVELEELQGGITEKTPVIIKMNKGQTKFSFSLRNKWIAAGAPTSVATTSGKHRLVGLFAKKMFDSHTGAFCYIVKDNKLMNPALILAESSTTNVGLKAFRAYLESTLTIPPPPTTTCRDTVSTGRRRA